MKFELDVNVNDIQAMLKKAALTDDEVQPIVAKAAKISEHYITTELYNAVNAHGTGMSTGLLAKSIASAPSKKYKAGYSTGYSAAGYYYRFVDDGHYIVDNRRGRAGRAKRNYKYSLTNLNNGGWYWGGYHFIEKAVSEAENEMVKSLQDGLFRLLDRKGLPLK